jgi:hypothetical protein
MATIVTRAGKGSPLTHNEVDANFNNLNNDKVEESTTITAGTGLTGGGDLSTNRTISLADTAVSAGSYGSASAVGTFTVDAQGRLTAASNTNIAIANTAVSGLGTMSTQNANNVAITGGSINGTTVGASTASTGAFTTLSASSGATISGGNLAFTTTAQRITGDMSNATIANRLAFQTSTANSNTTIGVLPNGTGQTGQLNLYGSSDPANTSVFAILSSTSLSEARLASVLTGTGSYLPMTFYTGGSERVRIDTSGNLGVGTSTASFKITNNFDAPATWGNDAANFIEMWQNSGTNALGVAMGDNSIASFTTNNGYNLVLATDGVERMRVATSTGNVGIGGTAGTKFQVFGNNETVRFTPASGTTSTTATFGTFRNSGNVFYFGLDSTNGDDFGIANAAVLWHSSANPIVFATNNTQRMRIDGSGNVGIGTSGPVSKLQVLGARYTANAGYQGVGYLSSSDAFGADVGAGLILGGGYTSTLTTEFAQIAGVKENSTSGDYSGAMLLYTRTNGLGPLYERMRINSAGNIGIGVAGTINGARLSVSAGTANATTYKVFATEGGSTVQYQQQKTTSVSTSATTILTPGDGPYAGLALIFGHDGSGNRFIDLVMFSVGTGTLNVISSLGASGSPAARTYSQGSSTYKLAMASGTYTVEVMIIGMGS